MRRRVAGWAIWGSDVLYQFARWLWIRPVHSDGSGDA
jgi:hypothetical protein